MPLKIIFTCQIYFISLTQRNQVVIQLTGFLQPEQKSSRHVAQCTAQGAETTEGKVWKVTDLSDVFDVDPTKQIVSQPAFGHQVRNLSNSTSANEINFFLNLKLQLRFMVNNKERSKL